MWFVPATVTVNTFSSQAASLTSLRLKYSRSVYCVMLILKNQPNSLDALEIFPMIRILEEWHLKKSLARLDRARRQAYMESGEPISGSNPGTTDVKIKEIPHQKRQNWYPKRAWDLSLWIWNEPLARALHVLSEKAWAFLYVNLIQVWKSSWNMYHFQIKKWNPGTEKRYQILRSCSHYQPEKTSEHWLARLQKAFYHLLNIISLLLFDKNLLKAFFVSQNLLWREGGT